ncbi:MAG: helix-turn-helix domain-containing protein [Phycisphaerae bacterium]|nr:helix-turn-helix domain-containing protein [Phycisphaerae bacterium]
MSTAAGDVDVLAGRLLLRESEAARVLGISPRKLWALAAGGRVPVCRIDGLKRYSVDDLKALIAAARTPAMAEATAG